MYSSRERMDRIMYTGEERRKEVRYCEGHITLCEDMAIVKTTVLALDKRINGTIGAVERHIENSRGRNIAIGTALVGIIIFMLNFAYNLGESKKQISINTERWTKFMEMEEKIR
jgi:hypothetical protein